MMNNVREKEINRDYYLKRAIIYLLIFTLSPFLTVGNVALFSLVIYPMWKEKIRDDFGESLTREEGEELGKRQNFADGACWTSGIILELLITLLPLILAIYHFYKFWKSYKACQELANPILSEKAVAETETERERERESKIDLWVGSEWEKTLP